MDEHDDDLESEVGGNVDFEVEDFPIADEVDDEVDDAIDIDIDPDESEI